MSSKPKLRDLARRLELSPTTVSEALRGVPRVSVATRERVRRAAAEMGYVPNGLVGAVMSELRRARADSFRGTLAVLDPDEERRRPAGGNRFHAELVAGAVARAEELGFKVDALQAEMGRLSRERLHEIVQARGVRGVLLLPMLDPDFAGFDFEGLSVVYADYTARRGAPHCVCADHYGGMMLVMERLRALGYRRPGLVIQDVHDRRLSHRWEAGHAMFRAHHGRAAGMRCPPACVLPYVRGPGFDAAYFLDWFAKCDCDVIIAHQPRVRTLMEEAGARVPETHGFCYLNLLNCSSPCAGLDLRPRLLGARGVELLVGLVLRNETGLPARPLTTTMPVDWVDGPTLPERKARR
jgi:LacI family transcriptional regulator